MQCQVNDVIVNVMPKFSTSDPTGHMHALTIKDPDHPAQTVILPVALQGVTSLINVMALTLNEWNSDAFKQLHLTSESLTWDPTTTLYEELKSAMIDYSGYVMTTTHPLRGHVNHLAINLLSSLATNHADVTDDDNVYHVLASHVQISSIETSLNGHICSCKTASIDPLTLAAHWMISPEHAKHIVITTMQRGVQTYLNPTLSRQFPTDDQMLLRYKPVLYTMISNIFFAGSVKQQGNKMAQAFATSFGWARSHPMKHKGDAHETLSLVFQCNCVPSTMVTNDSKEQTKGEFQCKLKEADCHP
jgi:hypothetical protein